MKPTELAHALESLANQKGFTIQGTMTPSLYRSFVGSIKDNGRVHELLMMMKHYLSTNPLAALKVWKVGLQFLPRNSCQGQSAFTGASEAEGAGK
ncbi:hypothetical protein ACFLWU_03025 [Chloroflexota bacterium]